MRERDQRRKGEEGRNGEIRTEYGKKMRGKEEERREVEQKKGGRGN